MQSLNAEKQDARGCTVDAFHAVRATTERLVQGLTPDDCMVQSMPDASPVKWHLAHTSWFFEQFILSPAGVAPFDERYAALFNSYYVGAGTRHPRARRGDLSRPPLDEVLAYRRHVTRAVADLLPRADPHATALARLGIEHEQQHQELILTDLKHHLFSQPLTPAYRPVPAHDGAEPAALQFTAVDGGLCDIGHAGGAFGFDNEFPRHRVWLEPFEITDRLVTEAEYLAFMHDGGYAQATLWLSDGWATREAEGWQAPLYWRADEDGAWQVFTLGGWRAPRADVPVCHVSHYEADAFAGARRAPAHRSRMGTRRGNLGRRHMAWRVAGRRGLSPHARRAWGGPAAAAGRLLAMDGQRLPALPRLPRARRHRGRIQRQVHVGADGAEGRLVRHAAQPRAAELPQFLSARRALAVLWHPAGARWRCAVSVG